MDKLFKPNNCGVHKPEDVTDAKKKYESTGMENARIQVNASINPQRNAECKITTSAFQVEELKSKVETAIQPLQKNATFATSPELIAQEIKMKAELSAQDIFRLRIPQPRNRIERVCNDCKFYPVSEPRQRTPLVVLDLDSLRLIDPAIVSSIGPAFLDLLECAYEYFDIGIWSLVKMPVLIPKLEMLGLFKTNNNFKIHFILDESSMTPTYFTELSKVKDIEIVWNMFAQYNEHNAIMLNDYLRDQIIKVYHVTSIKTSNGWTVVDKTGLKFIIDFLAGIIRSRKSLLELNILMAKRYD